MTFAIRTEVGSESVDWKTDFCLITISLVLSDGYSLFIRDLVDLPQGGSTIVRVPGNRLMQVADCRSE